jgi:mannan endo-1,4-beta-mannosidase
MDERRSAGAVRGTLRLVAIAAVVLGIGALVVTFAVQRAPDDGAAEGPAPGLPGAPPAGPGEGALPPPAPGTPADPSEHVDPGPPPIVEVGIATGDMDPVVLDRFISVAGVTPDFVDVYKAWGDSPDFEADLDHDLARRGIRMKITWEPWDPVPSGMPGANQPEYALSTIVAGNHDDYVRRWARSIAAHDRPIILRFMHEMNGRWYPWGAGTNTNTAEDYVAAWRHVWTIFEDEGASANVIWEWAPNEEFDGSSPLEPLYPGDDYVDQIGISAYNWGARNYGPVVSRWRQFGPMVDPTLDAIEAFADRPLGVSETGSSSIGGDRAEWIDGVFDHALERELAFVAYFDLETQLDWRISDDADLVEAFRSGFARTRAR